MIAPFMQTRHSEQCLCLSAHHLCGEFNIHEKLSLGLLTRVPVYTCMHAEDDSEQ